MLTQQLGRQHPCERNSSPPLRAPLEKQMRRSLFVLGCVTESAAGRRRSRGSLLRAGADLGAGVQLRDRLLDVARVRGGWRELQVLLVRPAGGLLVVAHAVGYPEPA